MNVVDWTKHLVEFEDNKRYLTLEEDYLNTADYKSQ